MFKASSLSIAVFASLILQLGSCLFLVYRGINHEVTSYLYYYLSYSFFLLVLFYVVLKVSKFYLSNLLLLYFFLTLISIVSALNNTYFLLSTIFLYFLLLCIPLVWYSALRSARNLGVYYVNYILTLPIIYLILAPIEYIFMSRPTIMHLQFSGGQYHVFAILLFLLVADDLLNILSKWQKDYLNYILVLFGILTFSRIAIIIAVIYFLYMLFINGYIFRFKLLISLLIFFSFFMQYSEFFKSEYLNIVFTRFNIYSNVTGDFNEFALDENLDNDRFMIMKYLFERPIFEFFTGSGFGTTSFVLKKLSNGRFEYGSVHNFFLTSLLERGVLATMMLVAFVLKIFFLGINRFSLLFKLFLFVAFVSTTGGELFVHSRLFDMNMTLLLVFVYVNYGSIQK